MALIETLIRAGSDFREKDGAQRTRLHYCAGHGWLSCARLLTELGMEADMPDQHGYTPLDLSISSGHTETTLHFLRQGTRIVEKDRDVTLKKALSSSLCHADVIAFLVASGTDSNAPSSEDTTLMEAVKRRDNEILSLILKTRPNVNGKNVRGFTALHFAAASGQSALVETLLAHDADIGLTDDQGNTALHFALQFSASPQLIRTLLDHRADI